VPDLAVRDSSRRPRIGWAWAGSRIRFLIGHLPGSPGRGQLEPGHQRAPIAVATRRTGPASQAGWWRHPGPGVTRQPASRCHWPSGLKPFESSSSACVDPGQRPVGQGFTIGVVGRPSPGPAGGLWSPLQRLGCHAPPPSSPDFSQSRLDRSRLSRTAWRSEGSPFLFEPGEGIGSKPVKASTTWRGPPRGGARCDDSRFPPAADPASRRAAQGIEGISGHGTGSSRGAAEGMFPCCRCPVCRPSDLAAQRLRSIPGLGPVRAAEFASIPSPGDSGQLPEEPSQVVRGSRAWRVVGPDPAIFAPATCNQRLPDKSDGRSLRSPFEPSPKASPTQRSIGALLGGPPSLRSTLEQDAPALRIWAWLKVLISSRVLKKHLNGPRLEWRGGKVPFLIGTNSPSKQFGVERLGWPGFCSSAEPEPGSRSQRFGMPSKRLN